MPSGIAGHDAQHESVLDAGLGKGTTQPHEGTGNDASSDCKRQEQSGPAPQGQGQKRDERQSQYPARAEEEQGARPPSVSRQVHEPQSQDRRGKIGPGCEEEKSVESVHGVVKVNRFGFGAADQNLGERRQQRNGGRVF